MTNNILVMVALPWPEAVLFPNARRRTHWSDIARATAEARMVARAIALAAMQGPAVIPTGWSLQFWLYFTEPARARGKYDDDNVLGAAKAYRDGIFDAIAINDRKVDATIICRMRPEQGGVPELTAAGSIVIAVVSTDALTATSGPAATFRQN